MEPNQTEEFDVTQETQEVKTESKQTTTTTQNTPQMTPKQKREKDLEMKEEKDGIRMSWNLLPPSRHESQNIVVPLSALYTPLKKVTNSRCLQYIPVICGHCQAILNPFSEVDTKSKTWCCNICLSHNELPRNYHGITDSKRPAEMNEKFTTVEYCVEKVNEVTTDQKGAYFLFVIDTCTTKEKLETLKENLLMTLELLPKNSLVGLITFGTTVQLYELGFSECSKSYVFRGDKSPSLSEFQDQLGLSHSQPEARRQAVRKNIVVPLSQMEINITSAIEEVRCDPWPVKPGCKDRRCTGVALAVATSLVETGFNNDNTGGHVMLFVGGPTTIGEGAIVGLSKKEHIRLHNDIQSDNAGMSKAAMKFFNDLSVRLVKGGHTVDIFAACLDQVGLLEMKPCVEGTGGILLLFDEFKNPIFSESIKKLFENSEDDGDTNNLKIAFNGVLEVKTSSGLKIAGGLGSMTSMNRKGSNVSQNEIGFGGTNSWKSNCITTTMTHAFFFDMAMTNPNGGSSMSSSGKHEFIQFITSYNRSSGEKRIRVTTVSIKYANSMRDVSFGFDQFSGAVVLSRLAIYKAEHEYLFDVLRWLDRSLIRIVRQFSDYSKENVMSLKLAEDFTLLPMFLFHFRRSHFLRVFNSSPDETCFYRMYLARENVRNSMLMIQPRVTLFSFDKPPHAVNLDSTVLKRNVILLLDSFDTLLIYRGAQISDWVAKELHKDPKYDSLAKLLKLPEGEASKILANRFPYPQYLICDEGSSQARIIYSKVNPSDNITTSNSKEILEGKDSVVILTEDSSLQNFMKHLKELVVSVDKGSQ